MEALKNKAQMVRMEDDKGTSLLVVASTELVVVRMEDDKGT